MLELLKAALGGKKFSAYKEIKESMQTWLQGQYEDSFSRGFQALVELWQICVERDGDNDENDKEFSNLSMAFIHVTKPEVTFWLTMVE